MIVKTNMKEKLNALLKEAEINLLTYNSEIEWLNNRISFLKEHQLLRELEWTEYKNKSLLNLFRDYTQTVESIREILNHWDS